jgi:hypothetical protein
MPKTHRDAVALQHGFSPSHQWLQSRGETALITAAGTCFTARADLTGRGQHAGEQVIRFFQASTEFARAYKCCWGHYYNCNGTRIGMYCQALDSAIAGSVTVPE